MSVLYAGFSKIDITPKEPIGMDLHGMPRLYRGARGVMDRLFARVCYLESGDSKFLMIVCDMVLTDVIKPYHLKIKKELAGKYGLKEKDIWIVSTHCHSSVGEEEAPYSPFMQKVMNRYLVMLISLLIKSGKAAVESKQQVKIGYGQGEIEKVAGNRRAKLSDGSVVTGWGGGPTPPPGLRIVDRGSVDKNIGLVLFRDMKNKPVGAIVNYNSHIHLYPVLFFSSELAGEVSRRFDRELPGIVTVYTNGAEGDTALCPNISAFPRNKNKWNSVYKKEKARLGFIMVKKLVALSKTMKFEAGVKMKTGEAFVKIKNSWFKGVVEKISAVTINGLALVGEVEEMVVEYALQVKRSSPFKSTFIIGMNDIRNFYFTTTRQMEEGGYEPKLWIEPGSMDRVIAASVKLLRKLRSSTSSRN